MTFIDNKEQSPEDGAFLNKENCMAAYSIREAFQEREKTFLSGFAVLSSATQGRVKPEKDCSIRTPYQMDRDRIVYSNSFRRLKHKTQVFLSPLGDHYRTRLTHTLEVSEIARNIARALRMNEDLAEAIALGHDLGHTPFGHGGETALKEIYSADFSHSDQSLRVVDVLDNKGEGLNLTREVRDGILKHSKGFGDIIPSTPGQTAMTVEGRIVRVADIIAYLNHDLDDALRSGVITCDEVPVVCRNTLGENHSERARVMIEKVVANSGPENGEFKLLLGDDILKAMTVLRRFLYEKVYRSATVHKEFVKAKRILKELFAYFISNPDKLQKELGKMEMADWDPEVDSIERAVCDLIACMTDRYALDFYYRIFLPSPQV
ncbi:MAG: deoxyguanosinetriphosphate triphosphohydrolase [Desulfarculaceae bacterium]|nr:deoxyguanosinetriphosphate triphosphohydrolase [Desulfarculaceae bacterium]